MVDWLFRCNGTQTLGLMDLGNIEDTSGYPGFYSVDGTGIFGSIGELVKHYGKPPYSIIEIDAAGVAVDWLVYNPKKEIYEPGFNNTEKLF
jgi:hypothetical protein